MSDKQKISSQKGDRHRRGRHESKSGSNDGGDRYDRSDRSNDRHHRRHDHRSDRDSNHRPKGRDYSSSYHRESDRRDDRRRERSRNSGHRSRSRSHSRSRSGERNAGKCADNRSSRHTESIPPRIKPIEPANGGNPPEKGLQHRINLDLMKQQIQMRTGIAVPDYYNPGVVNPIRFAEQERKRKLLWSRGDDTNKPQESSSSSVVPSVSSADPSKAKPNQWNGLKFEGEKGTEMTEKFRKLMGIKDKDLSAEEALATKNESAIESQETLFRNLDLQYSIARLSAHTQRGVGLGFGGPQK